MPEANPMLGTDSTLTQKSSSMSVCSDWSRNCIPLFMADSGIMYILLRSVVCRAKQLPLLSPKALTGSHEYTVPQAS